VRAVAGVFAGGGPRWFYKKIDSALRGHPREELLAAMSAAGRDRALVAPAFPAEGRTTIGGRQYVAGGPVDTSPFGSPGAGGDLRAIFANDRGVPATAVPLATVRAGVVAVRNVIASATPGIVVADAATDTDLAVLARAASACADLILCGAAGFARQLAPVLPLAVAAPAPPAPPVEAGPVLVVAGSRHEATAGQLAALSAHGVPVVPLGQAAVDDASASVEATVGDVAAHLAAGRSVAVTTAGLRRARLGAPTVAARLAAVATADAVLRRLGGLVLTGGDVAAAVCAALGAEAIWLRGDVAPGLPWGTLAGGARPGLPVVTKAGSFGDEGALLAALAHLAAVRERTVARGLRLL
jgi:uncharacterized protein YgbK (DUF1537 family)